MIKVRNDCGLDERNFENARGRALECKRARARNTRGSKYFTPTQKIRLLRKYSFIGKYRLRACMLLRHCHAFCRVKNRRSIISIVCNYCCKLVLYYVQGSLFFFLWKINEESCMLSYISIGKQKYDSMDTNNKRWIMHDYSHFVFRNPPTKTLTIRQS